MIQTATVAATGYGIIRYVSKEYDPDAQEEVI